MLTRLPEDSLVRTTPQTRKLLAQEKEWPVLVELIAQLIEEVSILAADKRRKDPRTIERPSFVGSGSGGGIAAAIRTLQATARVRRAA